MGKKKQNARAARRMFQWLSASEGRREALRAMGAQVPQDLKESFLLEAPLCLHLKFLT